MAMGPKRANFFIKVSDCDGRLLNVPSDLKK